MSDIAASRPVAAVRNPHQDARRVVALAELGVIGPFLVFGVLATLSIWYAVFGAPLLMLVGPVAYLAIRVRRDPADDDRMRWLAAAAVGVASALTALGVGLLVVGLDDLDAPLDVAAAAFGAVWVAWSWMVAGRARRLVVVN